ncbi:hypothetical protein FJ970_30460 [Mesorhizobium sp. B2-1-8]|uniref:hypothetical protein n=1 Tax=Mesorhizobium sp. B2-1-8 TaxID=2589967 RepID=UPI00112EC098|nr:hypothetical protein [Mesorhizobium sp. B2-1-8]UCI19279.1 hypothetical protein FJ970_30460 [Mesorhizobium sp. B2-1-8]
MTKRTRSFSGSLMFDDETRDALYLNVGRCLSAWNQVEDQILHLTQFALEAGGHRDATFAAGYWMVVSFDARLKLCNAMISYALRGSRNEDFKLRWDTLNNRSHAKSRKRAEIAHGSVVVTREGDQDQFHAYFFPYYHKRQFDHHASGGFWKGESFSGTTKHLRVEDLQNIAAAFNRLRDDIAELQSDWVKRDILAKDGEQ